MKNITLTVDDQVLEQVRQYAAGAGTSVNKLVREFLATLANEIDQEREARELRELFEALDAAKGRVGPITWSRDELHDRRA